MLYSSYQSIHFTTLLFTFYITYCVRVCNSNSIRKTVMHLPWMRIGYGLMLETILSKALFDERGDEVGATKSINTLIWNYVQLFTHQAA